MNKTLLFLSLILMMKISHTQKITINGNKFQVNGQELFLNGINSPWQNDPYFRIDFIDTDYFELKFWKDEFKKMKQNKVNTARIWIHSIGNHSPLYDSNGFVLSPSTRFYQHLDAVINEAVQQEIYVLPTLWSFDMVIRAGSGHVGSDQFRQHRNVLRDTNKLTSYVDNVLGPIVERYKNNPYVFAFDIINEPEHMWENANNWVDGEITRNHVVRFIARCAAKIHDVSANTLVTVGSKWNIYNSSRYNGWSGIAHTGDNLTDAILQAQFKDSKAYLDFYSMHWYQWQSTGAPFDEKVSDLYPGVTKPVIISEYPGQDLPNNECNCTCTNCDFNISLANAYEAVYLNGFAGMLPWRNGLENDKFGKSAKIYEATNSFANKYPNLVFPRSTLSTSDNELIKSYESQFKLYPNPTTDNNITLEITLQKQQDIKIEIFNVIGQSFFSYTTTIQHGKNTIPLNLSNFNSTEGIIFVKVSSNNFSKVFKVFN